MPATEATEIVAVRNIFGPAEKIKETTVRETHSEGAGGTSSGGKQTQKDKGWRGDCSADEVAFYEEMIKTGNYRGEKDPNFIKDLEYAAAKRGAH